MRRAGKHVRGDFYIHRSALRYLEGSDRDVVDRVAASADGIDWNVVKVRARSVTLLSYSSFDFAPFPALTYVWRFDEAGLNCSETNYCLRANPPILHRKELLLAPSDPRREKWGALTAKLVALGAFDEPHLIGTRQQWERRLAFLGIVVERDEPLSSGGAVSRDPA